MSIPEADIVGKRSRTLLTVSFGGAPFRFHTGAGDVTLAEADGVEHVYSPGLAAVSLETSSTLRMSESISIAAQPTGTTWAREYALSPVGFEYGEAELRHHYDGQSIDDARVILCGLVTSPSYGDSMQPLTFTLDRKMRQAGPIPHPSMRVGAETWTLADIDPEILGATYPLVIGRPGNISGATPCPVTPALLVDFQGVNSTSNKWLVNGVESFPGTVTLHDITAGTSTSLSAISHEDDALGRKVAVLTGVAFGAALGNEYRLEWNGTAGGALNNERTAPVEGLAEVTRYFFQRWSPSTRLDNARLVSEDLDAFKLAFCLNEPTDAWSVIQGHVLSLGVAELRENNDGLYLQYVDLQARSLDSEWRLFASLDDGRKNCEREGMVRAGSGRIVNRVVYRYGIGGQDQRPLRTVILDAEDDANTDARTLPSLLATISQEVYGVQELEAELHTVYEDATATRLAEEEILRSALPRRQIVVVGGPELDSIEVGTIGEYTESELHLDAEIVMLRSKEPAEMGVRLHLLVQDNYVTSERLTS
jgi:hypothetical protein